MKEALFSLGSLSQAVRAALFGVPKKGPRPVCDPDCSLEENIQSQLEWVTGAKVSLLTRGRDAFIFELRRPADHIARVAIRGDADAQVVMEKEKHFSDWVRHEFPGDLDRFALVEESYKITLDDAGERDVHVELMANQGNLGDNLENISGFAPKFMARVWLRIIKPVVLVHGKRKLVHGDIKPDNILVDLTPDGDYAFRLADWGGHFDPAEPRPPYEGTPAFQTRETLATGTLRAGDDVRALQLTFLEIYAGQCLTNIAAAYPDAFEMIAHDGKSVPYLTQIPLELAHKIPPVLLKILNTPYDNVVALQLALTQAYLGLEH